MSNETEKEVKVLKVDPCEISEVDIRKALKDKEITEETANVMLAQVKALRQDTSAERIRRFRERFRIANARVASQSTDPS